jgi:hypothetical protein
VARTQNGQRLNNSRHKHTTAVFAKAGLNNVTAAISKHQQWFGLDVQCSALVLNFNNIFPNGHLYRAGQSMNSLPSQILERCRQSVGQYQIHVDLLK